MTILLQRIPLEGLSFSTDQFSGPGTAENTVCNRQVMLTITPAWSYVNITAVSSIAALSEQPSLHNNYLFTLDIWLFSQRGLHQQHQLMLSHCYTTAQSDSIGFHAVVSITSRAISCFQQTDSHCRVRVGSRLVNCMAASEGGL